MEVKKHFFTTLGTSCSRFLNDEEREKLLEKLANADYGINEQCVQEEAVAENEQEADCKTKVG